ncbi:MAG: AraC family transcriptional regulator [Angelakisella sp.]|nr:AraC family transcriptional regulator [Angelakisella sp.]
MAHTHYYIDNKDTNMSRFSPHLLYTGTVIDDPNWFNIEHQHTFCELLYVARGKGHAIIGDSGFELKVGDLIIINPSIMHQERSCPESPLSLVFLGIDNFQFNGLPANYLINPLLSPVIPLTRFRKKVESCFSDLIYETSSGIPFYKEMSQNLVSSLVIFISRILSSLGEWDEVTLTKECQQIKDFIDRNYTQPLSLDTLSETAYFSKHHLAHLFKNQTGISPIKYIIEKRIESACQLLITTRVSIADISFQVGYQDPIYFSQLFKKSKGMSPSAYRKCYKDATNKSIESF